MASFIQSVTDAVRQLPSLQGPHLESVRADYLGELTRDGVYDHLRSLPDRVPLADITLTVDGDELNEWLAAVRRKRGDVNTSA